MAKILTVGLDLQRLSTMNVLFREHGHPVRGANCRSTMRHLLEVEPFQYIVILDPLPLGFAEALRDELRAGRSSPRVIEAFGMTPEDVLELFAAETAHRAAA